MEKYLPILEIIVRIAMLCYIFYWMQTINSKFTNIENILNNKKNGTDEPEEQLK